jgi:hypothetical protein
MSQQSHKVKLLTRVPSRNSIKRSKEEGIKRERIDRLTCLVVPLLVYPVGVFNPMVVLKFKGK